MKHAYNKGWNISLMNRKSWHDEVPYITTWLDGVAPAHLRLCLQDAGFRQEAFCLQSYDYAPLTSALTKDEPDRMPIYLVSAATKVAYRPNQNDERANGVAWLIDKSGQKNVWMLLENEKSIIVNEKTLGVIAQSGLHDSSSMFLNNNLDIHRVCSDQADGLVVGLGAGHDFHGQMQQARMIRQTSQELLVDFLNHKRYGPALLKKIISQDASDARPAFSMN